IRDVICSAVAFDAKRGRRSFGREILADDLGFVNQLHMDLGRLVRSWQRRFDTALLVRYEKLVAAPEVTLPRSLEPLDAAATSAVDSEILGAANATTPELDAHRTTPDPAASIGRWRTDLAAVHPDLPELCDELFAPLLAELGYAVAPSRARAMDRDLVD